MKFVLALLFLVGLAFAEPESDASADAAADAYYGYYGLGYGRYYRGYGGYYGYPGYYGYGYYGRKKREADPAVLATTHAPPLLFPILATVLVLATLMEHPFFTELFPTLTLLPTKTLLSPPAKLKLTSKLLP